MKFSALPTAFALVMACILSISAPQVTAQQLDKSVIQTLIMAQSSRTDTATRDVVNSLLPLRKVIAAAPVELQLIYHAQLQYAYSLLEEIELSEKHTTALLRLPRDIVDKQPRFHWFLLSAAITRQNTGNLHSVQQIQQRQREILQHLRNDNLQIDAHIVDAAIATMQRDNAGALQALNKAHQLLQASPSVDYAADDRSYMVKLELVYQYQYLQPQRAIELNKELIAEEIRRNFSSTLDIAYDRQASLYLIANDLVNAERASRKALAIGLQSRKPVSLAASYISLSRIYLAYDDHDKAARFLKSAEFHLAKTDHALIKARFDMQRCRLLQSQQPQQALQCLQAFEKRYLASSQQRFEHIAPEFHQLMAEIYAASDNYQDAYKHHKIYYQLSRNANSDTQLTQLNALNADTSTL